MNLLQEIVNKRTPKTLHNLIGSISQRFSPRVFSSHRIPDKHLEIIFEAARLAPSGRNNQPWFYYWIKKGSRLYKKLESCIPERNSTKGIHYTTRNYITTTEKRNSKIAQAERRPKPERRDGHCSLRN